MNLADLIEKLTELAETVGENTEVRLATQPHYPFYNSIAGVVVSTDFQEGDEEEEEETEYSAEDLEVIIYILEGSQIGYGSKNAWNANRY
jgi:hypothetical protein